MSGHIVLDETWGRVIYLSHIPSFENMYTMSHEMIIAETAIDRFGNYSFDIGFLPKEDNVFRLHIAKKGDSPNSLIIGGNDENHLFLILNGSSEAYLRSEVAYPPFKSTKFQSSSRNNTFQYVTDLVYTSDSTASESSQTKRRFIEDKLDQELLKIADTCSDPLISLYALYKLKREISTVDHEAFLDEYFDRWKNNESLYFTTFRKKNPKKSNSFNWVMVFLLSLSLVVLGFVVGRLRPKQKLGLLSLSVQERKILKMLHEGASNQEISDQYNIGLSTVKSHVSSIFSKLKVKSRKELLKVK